MRKLPNEGPSLTFTGSCGGQTPFHGEGGR